jgi:hypothetical protein
MLRRVILCYFIFCFDREAHVRASVAMDAIVAALCESHPSTALAYASSSY